MNRVALLAGVDPGQRGVALFSKRKRRE